MSLDNIPYLELPEHMQDAMRRYIENGIPPGDFLGALLSNDLKEAYGRADHINEHLVATYVKWLYNYAPHYCWGSKENFDTWIQRGGLEGMRKEKIQL